MSLPSIFSPLLLGALCAIVSGFQGTLLERLIVMPLSSRVSANITESATNKAGVYRSFHGLRCPANFPHERDAIRKDSTSPTMRPRP